MTTGLPFTSDRLTVCPVIGLLSEKSAAGNSGGKPSEHAMTEAQKRTSVYASILVIFIYSEDLFLDRATIQAMRIPITNPETSWI